MKMKRWFGFAVFAFSACSVLAHASDKHRDLSSPLAAVDNVPVLAGQSFEEIANGPTGVAASSAQGALPGSQVTAQQAAFTANSGKTALGKTGAADDNAVGEPEAFATLIAGIFLMGAVARRRKTRQRF
jgi:hypothetical protein